MTEKCNMVTVGYLGLGRWLGQREIPQERVRAMGHAVQWKFEEFAYQRAIL